jgi:O-antigen/teichoic acid export membrane protein
MTTGTMPSALHKPATAHHRLGFNVVSNWLGYAVSVAIGFVIAPLMVHKLGDVGYGIWALTLQLGTYISILDFGVRIALTRYVTHYHAKDDMNQVHEAFSAALTVLAGIGIISLLVTCTIVYFMPRMFHVPAELIPVARWTMFLIGLQISLSFPGVTFAGLLASVSRYDLINSSTIAIALAQACLVWLVLTRGYGLLAVALVFLACRCGTYLWQFALAWRVYGGFRFRVDRERLPSTLKPLLNFSFFAFLLAISGRLVLWTDNIVVGSVLGPALVTYYAIAGNLVDSLQGVLSSSMTAFVPLATSYDAQSEEEKLRSLFTRGSRFLLLLVLPAIIGMLVLGGPFIVLWMGSRYLAISGEVLILLAIPILFGPIRGTAHQILYGTNGHRFNAYASLGEAAVNLALSIFLAYRIGAVGVAWGTFVPAVLTAGVVVPFYTLRRLNMSWRDFYWDSWILPVLSGLPYMGLLYLLRRTGITSTWMGFWATAIGSLPLYYLFVWFLVLRKSEKEMVRHQVRLTLRPATS